MARMFPSKTRRASAVSLEAVVDVAGTAAVRAHARTSGRTSAMRAWRRVMELNSTAQPRLRKAQLSCLAVRSSQFSLEPDRYPEAIGDQIGLAANRVEE